MIRRCDECGSVYDDAACWTLCPHGPLGGGNQLCRIHDLDPCPICDPTATNPFYAPELAAARPPGFLPWLADVYQDAKRVFRR